MKKISVMIHQDYAEDVVKALHETGFVEIIDIIKEDPASLKQTIPISQNPEISTCMTYETRLTRLIDILNKRKKTPRGIRALLHPQLQEIITIQDRSFHDICSSTEYKLNNLEKQVITNEEKLSSLEEQKNTLVKEIEQISLLQEFDVDLSDFNESPFVIIKAGKTVNLPLVEQSVNSSDHLAIQSKEIGTRKKKEWVFILIGHSSEKETIEKLCKENISLFDFQYRSGSPKKAVKALLKQQKEIENQQNEINSELDVQTKKYLTELHALREELQIERLRKEISKNFTKTDKTYLIKGWILEKHEEQVQTVIDAISKGYAVYSSEIPSSNPDNPPIYLDTPKWAASFKTFLTLFAIPKYHELNPTIFLGIFFILFFGLMLGDAGYGLVILLLSLFGYFRFGKFSLMIKNWSFLGIWLGLSTTVVGFLTNSFFGDFIPRFVYHNTEQKLYSVTIAGVHLPVDALDDPLLILTVALIFGLIHLNLGLILGVIQAVRQRRYKTMITQYFSWFPLEIGGGLLIGSFILKWEIGFPLLIIAGVLTLLGILLFFIHAGPIGFFGITGYIGDWLSYARLLALGLATSGMALAFNVVAQLLSDIIPLIGIILLPILLIIMHTANLVIQALGAGVHSLRLQYVEFFNRFYEGGGQEFTPFKSQRIYTKIEEK